MKVQRFVRLATALLLLFALLGAGGCKKEDVATAVEEGTFSQRGESVVTPSGVRLFYGLPAGASARAGLPADWNASSVPDLSVGEEPGIHRLIIGKEVGGDGRVYFCIIKRYDLTWRLPAGVNTVAIEPGQPGTLQSYNPPKYGMQWHLERTPNATSVRATVYAIAIRYSISGEPSSRVIPSEMDELGGMKLYYKQ